MNRNLLISTVVLGTMIFVGFCFVMLAFSYANTDASLVNMVNAQIDVREAHFDKIYKVIQQKTQITVASSKHQKELVKSLIEGRQANFIKIIQESNPESAFSIEQFTNLSNAVEAQREGFFREQKELIDLVREQHTLHDSFPSKFFLSFFGREKVDKPQVISSSYSKSIVESGSEDDINLGL